MSLLLMAQYHGNYVYLIKEREFIRLHESVIKVGYSTSLRNRCRNYPKGSLVLAVLRVNDGKIAESAILSCFNRSFKKRVDLGAEYFEGKLPNIVALFNRTASPFLYDLPVNDTRQSQSTPTPKQANATNKIRGCASKQRCKVIKPSWNDVVAFAKKCVKPNKASRLHCAKAYDAYRRWAKCNGHLQNRLTLRQFCCALNKVIRTGHVGSQYQGFQLMM